MDIREFALGCCILFGIGRSAGGRVWPAQTVDKRRTKWIILMDENWKGSDMEDAPTAPAPTWVARYGPALFLAGLLPLILVLNSIRFWVETPESTATSVESVIARAVFSSECSGPGRQTVVIAPEPVPLLTPLFRSYDLGDRAPLLVSFEDAMQNSDFDASQCFVLSNLSDPRAESIQSTLNSKYPQKQTEILSDSSGLREVLIYR